MVLTTELSVLLQCGWFVIEARSPQPLLTGTHNGRRRQVHGGAVQRSTSRPYPEMSMTSW